MTHKITTKEYENDWANTVEHSPIHISQAKSGKKGYYCLGCNEEMQAVKPKKQIQPYFRHDATNIHRDKAKCTLASRNYREKIARDYFFRTKQIELPALYKYPPKDNEGQPVFLQGKYLLHSSEIKEELTFYENEFGVIHYGSNPNIEERFNLIRPDLTFFDEKGNPSLLIELVVTHKVNDDKKNKIRRLGINCVQVIVPKKDVLEIEKHLEKSSSYKWIYNEIEANTNYVPLLKTDLEELSQIDEEQRRLLEESFTCRKSQISNLIRSINKCIRTESYKGIERHLRSEISRIEEATEILKNKYRNEEETIVREATKKAELDFEERIRAIRRAKSQEQQTLSKTEGRHRELEARYFNKRRDLECEERQVEQDQVNYEFAIEEERNYITEHLDEREIRARFERDRAELEEKFRETRKNEREAIEDLQRKMLQPRNKLIERLRDNIRREEKSIKRNISGKEKNREEQRSLESEKEGFTTSRRNRTERIHSEILKRINSEDISRNDELSERIRAVLKIRRICRDFEDRRKLEQELRAIKK